MWPKPNALTALRKDIACTESSLVLANFVHDNHFYKNQYQPLGGPSLHHSNYHDLTTKYLSTRTLRFNMSNTNKNNSIKTTLFFVKLGLICFSFLVGSVLYLSSKYFDMFVELLWNLTYFITKTIIWIVNSSNIAQSI